jgi:hypothetical protein
MHSIAAITLVHERYMAGGVRTKATASEASHLFQATVLFRDRMAEHRGHFMKGELTALWCTAAMMYNLVFCLVEARTPEEAWPLRPDSLHDLNWLEMSSGKHEVKKISKPLHDIQDPAFEALDNWFPEELVRMNAGLADLPLGFTSLYNLDRMSSSGQNPYYNTATEFITSLNLKKDEPVKLILRFVCIINFLKQDLKELLIVKEPRALLLLACWYARMAELPVWWMQPRIMLEGQAICLYLERYHSENINIQVLLRYPKTIFKSFSLSTAFPG